MLDFVARALAKIYFFSYGFPDCISKQLVDLLPNFREEDCLFVVHTFLSKPFCGVSLRKGTFTVTVGRTK